MLRGIFLTTTIVNFVSYGICKEIDEITSLVLKVADEEGCKCVEVFDNFYDNTELYKIIGRKILVSSAKDTFIDVSFCGRPLHVRFNTPQASKIPQWKNVYKSVWIIIDNSNATVEELVADVNVDFDSTVIVAKMKPDGGAVKHLVYTVAEGYPLKQEGYVPRDFRKKRKNMDGFKFKGVVVEGVPAALFNKVTETATGFYPSIWDLVGMQMNFSTIYATYNSSAGSLKKGVWSGVIELLHEKKHDVIVSDINMTPERMDLLDFPHSVMTSRYVVYFKEQGLSFGYGSLLQPLHSYVWVVIGVWIFAGGFFVHVLTKYLVSDETFSTSMWHKLGYIESVYFVLQALCMQGSSEVPHANSLRILFFVSYLVSAVVIPSYSASLISSLTKRTPAFPFDSLEHILDSKYYLYVDYDSADYNLFTTSTNEIYQQILKEKVRDIGFYYRGAGRYLGVYRALCKEANHAAIISGLHMKHNIDYAERWHLNDCDLLQLPEDLPIIHQSVSLLKGSPYIEILGIQFLKFREFGILHREKNYYWQKFAKSKTMHQEITFADVSTIFIIYFVGSVFAFIILLCERIIYERHRRRYY